LLLATYDLEIVAVFFQTDLF